jgi:hypothetical protein
VGVPDRSLIGAVQQGLGDDHQNAQQRRAMMGQCVTHR